MANFDRYLDDEDHSWVGESGPELVYLPDGGEVIPVDPEE